MFRVGPNPIRLHSLCSITQNNEDAPGAHFGASRITTFPAKVKPAWSDNTDQAQQRPTRSGRPAVKRRSLKPVPEPALGAVRDTLRDHGERIVAGLGQAMTFMQARTANEVLKAQEQRVRLRRIHGELIDRAKAVAQVFKLARDERDAWVNWPARVAALMAAELGGHAQAAHRARALCA